MPGHVEFEYTFAKNTAKPARRGDSLRILVIGDFRGAAREDGEMAPGSPRRVDIDSLEQRLAALGPAVDASDARGNTHRIQFASLDDFHPDALFAKTDAFGAPSASTAERAEPGAPSPPPAADIEAEDDTFSRLLGQPSDAPKKTQAKGMLDSFIKNIVADDVVEADTHTPARAAGAAAAHTEQMRALLHDPAFQRLEASWRGLYDLVSELETGEELSIHFVDVGDSALRADLDNDDYKDCALFRTLVSEDHGRFGGQAWHVVVCDSAFDQADVRRLGNLGAIAAAAGGVVLAGAGDINAADETAPEFPALRRLPVAEHIGLAGPRVLLRLPYGKKSDPVDAFDFEECAGEPGNEELLWGNAALLVARSLGQTFLDEGFDMSPGGQLSIGERPAYTYKRDGESRLANVAETCLSDSEAEALIARGIMPMIAQRDGNRLLVPRVQSIADPAKSLRGAWS